MILDKIIKNDSNNEAGTNETAPEQMAETQKRSNKIVERLDNVVENVETEEKYRSSELVPLTAEFEKMKRNLRALVKVAKKYQVRMEDMQDAKLEFVEKLVGLSKESPIYDEIGADIDDDTAKSLDNLRYRESEPATTTESVKELKDESPDSLSMLGLYKFGDAQATANDNEYQSLVVDYVKNWERTVTEKVDAELKRIKELKSDKHHYEKKVEKLRKKVNKKEEKGKDAPEGKVEKLDRNEDKLTDAFENYESECVKACALIEAATHDGYKDLFPLVKNYLEWEMNCVNREQDMSEQLKKILDSLKEKTVNQSEPSAPKEHSKGDSNEDSKEMSTTTEEESSQTSEDTDDKDNTTEKKSE